MKVRHLFLALIAGITLAGYTLVFGDLGYLRQSQMRSDLEQLQAEIRSLEKENAALAEQYARWNERHQTVSDRSDGTGGPASIPARIGGTATILKFEENPDRTTATGASFFPAEPEPVSLTEARTLFLAAMFFLAVLGYYGLSRLATREN